MFRYQYDSWGNILSQFGALADENPYRYAGYQYDQETGLYYLIARYYHPEHGVFLSLDPDPGDADDILTQNGYTYANNNPVMLVDPDGKFAYAVGLYFVPGVGQVMLIGTAAVVGAYGAWYLGKKVKSLTSKGSLPLTGPRKGSLTLRDERGKVIQRRYYDSAGRAKKDMDYSDHGNPKHHPWGPHRHKWKWDGKKPKRGKAEPMNKGRRK